jgi:NAD(P)-dependent dehydrogenase (short-subunit alcohol dehydrogenase family)
VAREFAFRGCTKLFLVDIDLDAAIKTSKIITEDSPSMEVVSWRTDVSCEPDVIQMVAQCVERFGRVDFVSNNAGVGSPNIKTAELDVALFDKICAVNAKGVGWCLASVPFSLSSFFFLTCCFSSASKGYSTSLVETDIA